MVRGRGDPGLWMMWVEGVKDVDNDVGICI